MPNLTIQVRSDAGTKNPEAAQKTFDLLGTEEKETISGENTTHRWRMAALRSPATLRIALQQRVGDDFGFGSLVTHSAALPPKT
jgi:hypothetical protein